MYLKVSKLGSKQRYIMQCHNYDRDEINFSVNSRVENVSAE